MEVRSFGKNMRMSPRKARLVVSAIRNLDVDDAITQLQFMSKMARFPILKLVQSGVANAIHNYSLDPHNLYIKEAYVDMGSVLKRWTPKAFGRAAMIRKRMSHVSILISERVPTRRQAPEVKDENNDKEKEVQGGDTGAEAREKIKEKDAEKTLVIDPRMEERLHHREQEEHRKSTSSVGRGKKLIKKIFQRKTG